MALVFSLLWFYVRGIVVLGERYFDTLANEQIKEIQVEMPTGLKTARDVRSSKFYTESNLKSSLYQKFFLFRPAQKLPECPENESVNNERGSYQKLNIAGNRHGNMVRIPAPLLKQGISESAICPKYIAGHHKTPSDLL
jgi:hypothetical protein